MQNPHPPTLPAANSDETLPYAAKMGIGSIATTLGQPLPGLIDRLAYIEAAKPSKGANQWQDVNLLVSIFVVKTRKDAQEILPHIQDPQHPCPQEQRTGDPKPANSHLGNGR